MEIKILTMEQIPQAVAMARKVFDIAFGNRIDPRMRDFFTNYANENTLLEQASRQEVTFFGAYENDLLMGMSAILKAGHITMLYVDSPYLRRGISKALMEEMLKYARDVLKVEKVTTSVFPAYNVEMFRKRGFVVSKDYVSGMPYLPMEKKISRKIMEIPRKRVHWKGWLITFGIVVVLILITVALLIMDYLI